jgi:hypothetical protein
MQTVLRNFRDWLLYRRRRQTVQNAWNARHRGILHYSPEYARPCDPEIERAHLTLWRPLHAGVKLDTLRICANISGHADPEFVPEEVFAGEIERCMNPPFWSKLFEHKSMYGKFFPVDIFPEAFLHNLEGELYGPSLEPLDEATAAGMFDSFPYPVVLKPNVDAGGGKGVSFPASADELRLSVTSRTNFVVQRMLRQHPFLSAYNSHGLNTFRVNTYRSVITNQVHVLDVAVRFGRGGSLDNETAGGIVCHVHPDGSLHPYAVDKYGRKFDRHPDTGLPFGPGCSIPNFEGLNELATYLGRTIPLMRLVGWDFCLHEDGRWSCIELNIGALATRFAQYAGTPFFGPFRQEIIDYCLSHPRLRRANVRIS